MTGAIGPARSWVPGAGVVTLAHFAVIAAIAWLSVGKPPVPAVEPVLLIELPPLGTAEETPSPAPAQPTFQAPAAPQPPARQRVSAPTVAAPLPREFVAVPPSSEPASASPARPPLPAPAAAQTSPVPARSTPPQAAPAAASAGTSINDGDNPRAKQQEADYFALLSAHLNKRKRYPTEAKKARQQGIVTVRFTVHADGSVTGGTIRKSSGHTLLDTATLELLARVSPLPKFPRSMTKPSVTLSLPIDYSLQTS